MKNFNNGDRNSRVVYVVAYHENNKWYHKIGSLSLKESLKRLNKLRAENPDMEFGLFTRLESISFNQIL